LVLFSFIALSFAQYQVAETWAVANCSGDPIAFVVITSSGCIPSSPDCISIGSAGSVKSYCTASVPSLPSGVNGWEEYETPDCSGTPFSITGYTSGCVCVSSICYSITCDGSNLNFAEYGGSDTTCSGTPTGGAATTYNAGCQTVGSRSIQQVSCSSGGGASVDWNTYLNNWLSTVGQNWDIPTFAATSFYSSHSQWTINGDTVSVDITFTSSQSSDVITGFVAKVCTDMIQNANTGVCQTATTDCVTNPTPVHASCTWVTVSKKRQGQSSVITLNSQMNNGVVFTGLLGLALSFLILLL